MEEETSDLRADWESHPYTQSWAKKKAVEADLALRQLHACCSKSSDVDVRTAYVKYIEAAVWAKWMVIGGEKKK